MSEELSPLALRAADEIADWLAEWASAEDGTCRLWGLRAAARELRKKAADAVLSIPHIADELNVSQAYVGKLLDDGALPLAEPTRLQRLGLAGKRTRRVRLADVRAYRDRVREERRQVLSELAREAAESGLDDETDALFTDGPEGD
jgi:hypothetical protein